MTTKKRGGGGAEGKVEMPWGVLGLLEGRDAERQTLGRRRGGFRRTVNGGGWGAAEARGKGGANVWGTRKAGDQKQQGKGACDTQRDSKRGG